MLLFSPTYNSIKANRRYTEEVRKCTRQNQAFFEEEFYTFCMVEGGRVMKWNPSITAIVIGIIVWLLQRGPLNYGTFKSGFEALCFVKH